MAPTKTDFAATLGALTRAHVEFILVGGVAAILQERQRQQTESGTG